MRRKIISIILILILVFSNTAFTAANINVFIDGNKRMFENPLLIERGIALAPLISCFEDLGAQVSYNKRIKTIYVTKDTTKIRLQVGSSYGFINGKRKKLSSKPRLINKNLYISLKVVDELLETQSSFDALTKIVSIQTKKIESNKINLIDSQKYELRQVFRFINYGDEANIELKVLMGAISNSPYQNDENIIINPQPDEVFFDDYGNKYAKIKINNVKSKQEIQVETLKTLTNSGVKYSINQNNLIKEHEALYNVYTKPEKDIESDNNKIIQKAQELSKTINNPYDIAKKVFDFVNLYMTYDESSLYARKGAVNALNTGRGVCEDYSKLFVSLLRANNIPARSSLGFWIQEDQKLKLSYDTWQDITPFAHEWPEFYMKDYNWIICEPTFVYTLNGKKTVPINQFANQDSNGHIIYSYNSKEGDYISWRTEGYGELNIELEDSKTYIKKVR